MSARHFRTQLERHEGFQRSAYRLTCSKCGVTDSVVSAKSSGVLPDDVISKKFGQKGWLVGNNDRHDVCPGCISKRKGNNLQLVHDALKPADTRVLGRAERRIIFEKLREVYDDARQVYKAPWSDGATAMDLGVPRAWVVTVREENFGDIAVNEDMQEFLRSADAILTEAKDARQAAIESRRMIDVQVDELQKRLRDLDTMLTRLDSIEKLAANIRKMGAV